MSAPLTKVQQQLNHLEVWTNEAEAPFRPQRRALERSPPSKWVEVDEGKYRRASIA